MAQVADATYEDRLTAAMVDVRSAVCAGIDPSPNALSLFAELTTPTSRREHASNIERFSRSIVEAVATTAVAIKPQMAWFETAGADGLRALERCVDDARSAGLLVVLDGKRGDIPHSAAAYADAYLGSDASSGICADAMTVNAAIGVDSLAEMATIAHARGCQLYALAHTSNPGSVALQRAELAGGDGRQWWHLIAEAIEATGTGAVIGATHRELLADVRKYLPTAPLLVPGVGAQGGSTEDLAALARYGASPTLIPVSRSLLPQNPLPREQFIATVLDLSRALAAQSTIVLARTPGTSGTIGE